MNESKTVYVFSDSHGKASDMIKIIRDGKPDMVFHLGDCVPDIRRAEAETGVKCYAVRGNCDFSGSEEEIRDVIVMGQKITLVHGDRYAVKYSYDRLLYLGAERQSKAVLFGHTHEKYCEYRDGIWIVNPGSISLPRGECPSYAELIVGSFGVVPKIKEYI